MRIGGDGAGNGEAVGAGLLLRDAPDTGVAVLQCEICIDQFRPLDSGFHFKDSPLAIEVQNAIHFADIDQQCAAPKLLAAHGVPPACDGDELPVLCG